MSSPLRITVFGGTGFLGRAIIQGLAEQGFSVRVPSRRLQAQRPWSMMGLPDQISPVFCNPRQDQSVAEAIQGSDIVINLIGILAEKGPYTFQNTHVETAARLARLARAAGVKKFIHVSALGASLQSRSRYARSKAVGEEAVRAFFPEAIIVRPSLIYGADDQFFNRFAQMARFVPILPLIGGGKTQFQPLYVGDMAEAVSRLLHDRRAEGRTYLFGGPQLYSFRALLTLTLRAMNRTPHFIHLPWDLAFLCGWLGEKCAARPLTRDQVKLLQQDSVIEDAQKDPIGTHDRGGHWTIEDLGIAPRALEPFLPDLVGAYRAATAMKKS